jgi:hypothetical protein
MGNSLLNKTTIQSLAPIIGKWNTEGKTVATADEKSIAIRGTDKYEWVLSNQFILHTVDVRMGDQHVNSLELIGYDKERDEFILRSFDDNGGYTEMTATLNDNEELLIVGDKMRSRFNFSAGVMTAIWERSDDNKHWHLWMDMKFSK